MVREIEIERIKNEIALKALSTSLIQSNAKSSPQNLRSPQSLQEEELRQSDRIIAIDESEHRPLMVERFPLWENQIEYWLIHDINQTPAHSALDSLEQQIHHLIEELKMHP